MTPDGWGCDPLGSVGDWLSGGTPSKQSPSLWEGLIPWVSPKDMKRSHLSDAIDHVAEAALGNGTQLAPKGSLLMVVRGMILAHTFPVARAERALAFNQDIKVLVPNGAFDSRFLLYWLQDRQSEVLRIVDVANHGTKRLASERLFALEVPKPPLPQQRKIAAILSSLDDAIESTKSVIDQLGVVKKAMMAELLTRGLPGRHTKFKQTEIGEVPEGWEVASVGEVGTTDAGKAIDPRASSPHRPYLRVANVFDGGINVNDVLEMGFTDAEFRRFRLEVGDVLLNEGQSLELVGRCSMYRGELARPCAIQNSLLRFRAGDKVDPGFAEQYFRFCQQSGRFASIATQTTSIAHLGLKRFASMRMPIPSRDEQAAISAILGDPDARMRCERASVSALRSLKSALMSVLLTGDLRVTPDEPAP